MNLNSILRGIVTQVRTQGMAATFRNLLSRARIRFREWELFDLGIDHPERRQYAPTHYTDFVAMAAHFGFLRGDDVFIDFGAGLGRVVILAAMMPFRRVIGIELSDELCRRARENLAQTRANLRCKDVDVIAADATAYEIPRDATVLYFYNPFSGEILASVLRNIRHSIRQHPRSVTLACNLPKRCAFDTEIRKVDWLRLVHEFPLDHDRQGLIYEAHD